MLACFCFASVCQLSNPIKYNFRNKLSLHVNVPFGNGLEIVVENLTVLSNARFPYFNEGRKVNDETTF